MSRNYRKYPRIMHTFSTKILTSKLGCTLYVGIFVYVWVIEKYHICGLKVGVGIICGCALYMGIYGKLRICKESWRPFCAALMTLDSDMTTRNPHTQSADAA